MGTKPQTRKRPAGPVRRTASSRKSPKPPTAPASNLAVRPLDESTWPDFARLVEKHNGVWGGCWCMGFHPEGVGAGHTREGNREAKRRHVTRGTVHQVLVYDGDRCVGSCQFGSPAFR